jgi:hypothetical protein
MTVSDLRFLAEPPAAADWTGSTGGYAEVEVPNGLSTFSAEPDAAPRLVPHAETTDASAVHFEPLRTGGRSTLLMHSAPEASARVNGRPAPVLAALEMGDQVRIGHDLLHLTRFRRIEAIVPNQDQIGRKCPVCRVDFVAETRVVVHDCGAILHLEPETVPDDERLECALLGCPSCREPVEFAAGFVFEPEVLP